VQVETRVQNDAEPQRLFKAEQQGAVAGLLFADKLGAAGAVHVDYALHEGKPLRPDPEPHRHEAVVADLLTLRFEKRGGILDQHAGAEGLVPDPFFQQEVEAVLDRPVVGAGQDAPVAKRPRPDLHPPLEPEDDLTGEDEPRRLRRRIFQKITYFPLGKEVSVPIYCGTEIEVGKAAGRRAVQRSVGGKGRPDCEPPVTHVGKDEKPLHTGQFGEQHVHFDVGKDPSRNGQPLHSRPFERLPDQSDDALFKNPLGHEGELLRWVAPEDRLKRPEHLRGVAGRDDIETPHPDDPQHRVFGVGDRVGKVGQRHHFPFIFQFAHVHQVRHVLEEDPE